MNVIKVHNSYSLTKDFIILSFMCKIGVCEVDEILNLGKMLVRHVGKTYVKLLKNRFLAKTTTPVVFGKGEEVYMIWSFTGTKDNETLNALKKFKIEEVKYE